MLGAIYLHMKYVYVLTSTTKDLYYEQAVMSAFSLKHHMPSAQVVVLCDNKTASSFTAENKRTELSKYAEIVSIDFADDVSNVERSRLIKTSIPDYIKDDFLYIDCDTIICDDLSEAFSLPFPTGGILDGHCNLDEHIHRKYFLKRDKKLGFSGTKALNGNINGGIILGKNTGETRELFKAWNDSWKYSAYQKKDLHDQSALNQANYLTGMKMQLMDGIWNCQPSHGGLAFLKNAKIIHYYSSEFSGKTYIPYYKLADKSLQNRIKEAGSIPEDIKEMILDPKFQFNSVHLINDSRIVSIMQSPLVFTLADIKAKMPWLFNIMESLMAFLRSIGKKLKS